MTKDPWKCRWARWRGLSEITGHLTCVHEKEERFGLSEGEFGPVCDHEKCGSLEEGRPNAEDDYPY